MSTLPEYTHPDRTSSLNVRQADSESFKAALNLVSHFFQEEGLNPPAVVLQANLLAMIASPTSAVLLAWRGSNAVGVATVTTSVGLEYGLSADMEDLYILPKERACGIARTSIDEFIAWCIQRCVTAILVPRTPGGDMKYQLLHFYQRQDFSSQGRLILERTLTDEK